MDIIKSTAENNYVKTVVTGPPDGKFLFPDRGHNIKVLFVRRCIIFIVYNNV